MAPGPGTGETFAMLNESNSTSYTSGHYFVVKYRKKYKDIPKIVARIL